jgi:NADH:ubiquinone oxidoreductase subunit 2 (subunit N)
MPLTVGFFGKLYVIQPALGIGTRQMNWLAAITAVNAAVGAAYYLRIVATMFLRPEPIISHPPHDAAPHPHHRGDDTLSEHGRPWWASAVGVAIVLSASLTLVLGTIFPATNRLSDRSFEASKLGTPVRGATMTGTPATTGHAKSEPVSNDGPVSSVAP